MTIGLFPMVADILHAGHVCALEEAKKHCDKLVIALNCGPSYKQPVQSIYERCIQLRAVKFVDDIIVYDDDCLEEMLGSFNYDIYFVGDDYKQKRFDYQGLVEKREIKIHYITRSKFSSTDVKNRVMRDYELQKGDNI